MTGLFERAMAGLAVLVLLALSFPTAVIVPMSFGTDPYLRFPPRGFTLQWYGAFFSDRDWTNAALFSLKVATAVAICSMVLGTGAALALRARVPGFRMLRLVVTGPMILPQIVVAVAMLLFWSQLRLTGSLAAFIAAHTCLALPYVTFTVAASLARYDGALDAAALMCGASHATIIRRITLPLIRPGIVSGGLFAFLISFDEPVVAFFLSGLRDKALARKFFEDVQINVTPTLAAVATLLTMLAITILLAVGILTRKITSRTQRDNRP